MFKLSSIFLSLIILIQSFNFDLEGFPKLVVLANHFAYHLEEGEGLSEFISQHYGGESNEHNDKHEEHEDLPFKHQHLDTHINFVFIICNEKAPFHLEEEVFSTTIFLYKERKTKLFEINFFQPPRIG